MTEFDDYHVTGRSNAHLERAAGELRAQLGFAPEEVPTASLIMKRANERLGIEIVPRPDAEMGRKEAFAVTSPPRIFLQKSVFDACGRDEARARMTLVHELCHLVLHPGAPKARMADGSKSDKFIRPFNSAEHQAGYMAAAFQMPRQVARRADSIRQLQIACRVSAKAAAIRFSECQPKQEPAFVRAELQRLERATAIAEQRQSTKYREEIVAWERAAHIPGEDPMSYRMSTDGFRIGRYNLRDRNSPCGWFVCDGRAYAYFAKGESD